MANKPNSFRAFLSLIPGAGGSAIKTEYPVNFSRVFSPPKILGILCFKNHSITPD